MKRLPLTLLLVGLSTGFFTAWLASIADYRIENRLEATKKTINFSDLQHRDPGGERSLRIKNLYSTPDVNVGEVVKLEFDNRVFEFCTVRNGKRAFTFCRERTGAMHSLAEVLKSPFEGRTEACTRLSWLIGDHRVDDLLAEHDQISRSEIILVDHRRDSRLKESTAALVAYWALAFCLLYWNRSKLKPDEYWQRKQEADIASDFRKSPAVMALIGGATEPESLPPLANVPIPLTDGPRRCRNGGPNKPLHLIGMLLFNMWNMPFVYAISEIVEQRKRAGVGVFSME